MYDHRLISLVVPRTHLYLLVGSMPSFVLNRRSLYIQFNARCRRAIECHVKKLTNDKLCYVLALLDINVWLSLVYPQFQVVLEARNSGAHN
jgi:hypothetical protein